MGVFNIELINHIIITENEYVSMKSIDAIDKNYEDKNINFMEKSFLIEDNKKLKLKLKLKLCDMEKK